MRVLEAETFERLKKINTRIYELDHKPFELDEGRDVANLMHTLLNNQSYEVSDAEIVMAQLAPEFLSTLKEMAEYYSDMVSEFDRFAPTPPIVQKAYELFARLENQS